MSRLALLCAALALGGCAASGGSSGGEDGGVTPTLPVCQVAGGSYVCANLNPGEALAFSAVDGGPPAFGCTTDAGAPPGAACAPGAPCTVTVPLSPGSAAGVCEMR